MGGEAVEVCISLAGERRMFLIAEICAGATERLGSSLRTYRKYPRLICLSGYGYSGRMGTKRR
jgi:hypothetical protein